VIATTTRYCAPDFLSVQYRRYYDMLQLHLCVIFLAGTSFAVPSFDHTSLSSFGSVLSPKTFPMEIRGVYGGRKRRYIVERDEPACSKECRNKPPCFPTLGEIVKDCQCQKCGTKVPTLDGKNCEDNCPQGTACYTSLLYPAYALK
jgi:hypothetical protein